MPISLIVILILFFAIHYKDLYIASPQLFRQTIQNNIIQIMTFLIPIITIRFIISFYFHREIIFHFSWAKPITLQDNPELYNIVENLCISRWLPTVKIWIIQDPWMNAFATWRWKNARIVFTTWLLENLNKQEIEAVAWHELTHIINKDTLLMTIIVVFVGIFSVLGEILFRIAWSRDDEDNKTSLILYITWIAFRIIWILVFPLIRLAISRKREFLADAWSVELTKDKYAMISALEKISKNSEVQTIKQSSVAAMCIENPLKNNFWSELFSTHPSIESRIKNLLAM